MSAPGVGVQDIIKVIVKCKDIYTAFADEYESAPARVQELVDTCRYLTNVFSDITAIDGGGGGVPEELHRTFLRKLEECNVFIKRYHALKRDFLAEHRSSSITNRLLGRWQITWQTGRYAFDGKTAKELRDALDLETGKLLLFVMTSMRNRANNSTSLTTSAWGGAAHGPPGYDPRWIENIFARLRSISNRYEREMSASVQLMLAGPTREPDLSGVYAEMYGVWDDFCSRAGLPTSSRPPLPIDWLAAPVRSRYDAVLNATRPSVHYTLPQPKRIETLQSEPDWVTASPTILTVTNPSPSIARTVASSNVTTPLVTPSLPSASPPILRQHGQTQFPFSSIPPPEFYQATAYVTLAREGQIKLREWCVDRSGARPKLIWLAERPPGVLEHVLPKDVFPETLHNSLGKTSHVSFPLPKDHDEGHHLVWKPETDFRGGGSGSSYDTIVPEYQFVSSEAAEARRVFQSDVRDKHLVTAGTFDTDVIWTDRTETRHSGRESWGQDLKMWCGRSSQEGRYSLSFNVTNGPYRNRHVECEMGRFVPTTRTGGRDHTHVVYLDFASDDRDSQSTTATDELHSNAPSPTGLGRTMRRFSGMFSRSQGGERSRASRSSFTSQRSAPLISEDDFFANLRYLAVQFSEVEDAKGCVVETAPNAAGRFRKLFEQKRKEETSRSPMLPPNPRFTAWDFDLGESAVPSHEEAPQRSSRDVSPTSRSLSPPLAQSPDRNPARTPSELLGFPR